MENNTNKEKSENLVNEPMVEYSKSNTRKDILEILDKANGLSENQINILIDELKNIIQNKEKPPHTEFQEFLLSGPIMTDAQYAEFLETKKHTNKWRIK
jgi:hypothetical protein